MARSRSLKEWNGGAILDHIERISKLAIDETLEEAAEDAHHNHWWANRSGDLETQIKIEKAIRKKGQVVGRFGTTKGKGFYGLFHERRRPFIRPAGDRHFPKLADRIRRRF